MYEGDRLVRSVTVREPEWSDGERAALLNFMAEDRAPRGAHGHLLSDAMSPDGDPASWGAGYVWHVPDPSVDFAQQALDRAKDAYQKSYPDADLGSLLWRVEKRER